MEINQLNIQSADGCQLNIETLQQVLRRASRK